jgi:hypothetical protein
MLKTGIYVPYVKNETSLASVMLADWLLRLGVDVCVFSDSPVRHGIHRIWDQKVRRYVTPSRFDTSIRDCTHLFWFKAACNRFLMTHEVPVLKPRVGTCKDIYFPNWSDWQDGSFCMSSVASQTVSLSQSAAKWLSTTEDPRRDNKKWTLLTSPDIPLAPRRGRAVPDRNRILVVVDRSTVLDIGVAFLRALERLLQEKPNTDISILLSGSVDKSFQIACRGFALVRGPERVTLIENPPYYDYCAIARNHDWIYLAQTRCTYGSLYALLFNSTVPIICHAIPPLTDHRKDVFSCAWIPCKVIGKSLPIATVELDAIFLALSTYTDVTELVLQQRQQAVAQQVLDKQIVFERFLNRLIMT